MVLRKTNHRDAYCMACLDNGCSHCVPELAKERTMWNQAVQRARGIYYVRIKDDNGCELKQRHSTLWAYTEHGQQIEFVANFGSPAVGGYIVQIEGDAPIYMNKAEFDKNYLERTNG